MNTNIYIKKIINQEKKRQENSINLIASENYIDKKILSLQSSIFSNKYAEGYPNKRYYAGCKYIDKIENLAIDKAKKLFNAKYANVQPHSGSQANQSVYLALCNPNDKILGLQLSHGGHLTHGNKNNYSGHFYTPIYYTVKRNEYIDYNLIYEITKSQKPKIIIAGTSAYSRIINWYTLKNIAKTINAYLLADISHIAGLIISNIYPSPINIADIITSTLQKTLRGPRGGIILTNNEAIINKINKAVFPGIQGGPAMNIIAAKALCLNNATSKKFKNYQKTTIKNAKMLANLMKKNKFLITSNGTDTHLFLVNLKNLNLSGEKAEKQLEKANIIVNKNIIPYDTKKKCTGIRIGTPAITTRGFKKAEIKFLNKWIYQILIKKTQTKIIKKQVIELCKKYPIYKTEHNEKNF